MKKLDKKNIEDIFALTPMQEGMLFHFLKEPDSDIYYEQLNLGISGAVETEVFEKAWNLVAATNEMLRVVFHWEKLEKPVQIILKEHRLQPEYVDITGMKAAEQEKHLEKIRIQYREKPFDLSQPPFRVTLCKIDENRYEMIISNHHILYDGWSNGIILKEFFDAYQCLTSGREYVIPVKTRFKEFLQWIHQQDKLKQRTFWSEYLGDVDTPTVLPVKKSRNSDTVKRVKSYSFILEKDTTDKLDVLITGSRLTWAPVLYAAWGILLQKYCNSGDVIFGVTVSGRSPVIKGIEDMVGLFINTLPLRVQTHESTTVMDILLQLDRELQDRERFEHTPLTRINRCSAVKSESLFDSLLVIENYPIDKCLTSGNRSLTATRYSAVEITHYDLTVGIELLEGVKINFVYRWGIFAEESIAALAGHFSEIANKIAANPGQRLNRLEIISEQEKKQILFDFNNIVANHSPDPGKTIRHFFEEQVEQRPHHVSLTGPGSQIPNPRLQANQRPFRQVNAGSGNISITYKELNHQTNRLARILIEKGVKSDIIVGIMVERSMEMVMGILAILKSGGAYLPIDPGFPQERIDYMLKDSNAGVLLTTAKLQVKVKAEVEDNFIQPQQLPIQFINIEMELASASEPLPSTLTSTSTCQVDPTNLAYVIYTSGSTGKPKGVMVNLRPVVNLLLNLQREYPLEESDVYLLKTSFIFDVSVTELFGWFPGGGRLAILNPGQEKDPGAILDIIERCRVTHINFVPSLFKIFLEMLNPGNIKKLSYLRYIFLAGEAVLPGLVQKARSLNINTRLENLYGPTEATVYASGFSLSKWNRLGSVPIGKPLDNSRLYILDRDFLILPVGVAGQLCIGGKGLARGYLNKPGLTTEKFDHDLWVYLDYQDEKKNYKLQNTNYKQNTNYNVQNYKTDVIHAIMQSCNHASMPSPHHPRSPYSPHSPYSPIYKTGDLARWMPDGNIQFLGRMDHQVKIRGFRIELGEIEHRLLTHKKIKEAVVMAREDKSDEYLCAYIVAKPGETWRLNPSGIREYLANRLPGYMVPGYFVQLDGIPLTPSGKIDRKMLPAPGIVSKKDYVPPRDDIEEKLLDLWSWILELDKEKISIDDNFFHLGGNSLQAVRLCNKIHERFNLRIPLNGIFNMPTPAGLSRLLKQAGKRRYPDIQPLEKKEYYRPSSAQKRLFTLQRLNTNHTAYNMTGQLLWEGDLDLVKLKGVFTRLISRHESLRTSFHMMGEEVVQRVHDSAAFEIRSAAVKDFVCSFDLTSAPLLRVGLQRCGKQEHILLVDMHHIISDGISLDVLIHDFITLYSGDRSPSLKIQYKEFSEWENRDKKNESILKQGEYWKNRFKKKIPRLHIPTDYARPGKLVFEGDTRRFKLSVQDSRALRNMAVREEITVFMALLAVYNIFLSKITSQEDIIVGTPTAGRSRPGLEQIIGNFVNMLVLRNFPREEKPFRSFLAEVKKVTLDALENQDYPFEKLVNNAADDRNISRNPIFDVMFQLVSQPFPGVEFKGVKLKPLEYKHGISKYDLSLIVFEEGENLTLDFEYNTRLFKKDTIKTFFTYFSRVLSAVLENPDIQSSGILIASREKYESIKNGITDNLENE